ncbi:MAG: type II toxin-antitoxin system VapC family toxin [Terriglobales bacterium]
MKYLLDTVAWLWSVYLVERLGAEARDILENGREEIYLSAATAWEVSIKMRLGKLNFPGTPAQIVPVYMAKQGLLPVPVTHLHAVKVYDLPSHHSDPFDRLIIAQAMVEEMTVLTSDRIFEKYPVDVVWCGK